MGNGKKRFALAATLAAMACALPLPSPADVRVLQLYSTPDGEYQAVLLEDTVNDAVDRFRGLTLVMHASGGTSRSVTLTPDRVYETAVVVDGTRRFLVATRQLSFWLRTQAELPNAFLETDGGTLRCSAANRSVIHRLRTTARSRSTTARPRRRHRTSRLRNIRCPTRGSHPARTSLPSRRPRPSCASTTTRASIAISLPRRNARRPTSTPGTGLDGNGLAGPSGRLEDGVYGIETVPVSAITLPPPFGDTHFFSAFADECEAVARQWPSAILETAQAFRVALPERTNGLCMVRASAEDPEASTVTVPIFRAWNGRADANHRYSTSLAEQSEMLRRGWIAEGYGPYGATMCVEAYDVDPIPGAKQPPRPPRVEDSR